VFSAGALSFLERDEPEIYRALAAQMESWPAQKIVHRNQAVLIDGNGFSAIARLKLLELLQERAGQQGVQMTFGCPLSSLDGFAGFDLRCRRYQPAGALTAFRELRCALSTIPLKLACTVRSEPDRLTLTLPREPARRSSPITIASPSMSTFIVDATRPPVPGRTDRMSEEEAATARRCSRRIRGAGAGVQLPIRNFR
jgi:hypothetical protein